MKKFENLRIVYKDLFGSICFSEEDNCWHGKILDIGNSLVSYESQDLEGLDKSFREAVDDYLEVTNQEPK